MSTAEPTKDTIHSLYLDHHSWLLKLLQRRLGSADDAADLAQDAFLRLMARAPQFDSQGNARAYLTTVAKGLCVDLWRRREVEAAWLETLKLAPETSMPSPEHQALVFESLLELDAMLRRLPEKASRALILSRLEGMTYRAIGERLGISERMVKKYMARAIYECAVFEMEMEAPSGAE